MEKEFNLSNLKEEMYAGGNFYHQEDVKEFIKRLKEELSNPRMVDDHPLAVVQLIEEKINKLAGKDLI